MFVLTDVDLDKHRITIEGGVLDLQSVVVGLTYAIAGIDQRLTTLMDPDRRAQLEAHKRDAQQNVRELERAISGFSTARRSR